MIQVALLSKWHVHAVDYAREAIENPNLAIHTIWDEDKERGRQWAEELDVLFEENLESVLSNPDIDAVIVSSPTYVHTEVITQAARHKKHIFTEKILAFTVEECEAIFDAVKEAQVELMVSLPRLTKNYYLYAQDVLDSGVLGELTMIRCRLAHNGSVASDQHPNGWLPEHFYDKKTCGGGAFIDLGAHPIYLANRLAGEPKAVTGRLESMKNSGVDDHAVALVEYKSGTMAVLETSFLSAGSPFQLELYGTEGTLMIEEDTIRLRSSKNGANDWIEPEQVPEDLPMPMEQWVHAIQKGTAPSITKDDVRNLTLVNEAAARSHDEGKRVEV